MRKALLKAAACCLLAAGALQAPAQEQPALREALKGKFLIGAAVSDRQLMGRDTAGIRLLRTQFNAIVGENCMKCQSLHPEEHRYRFELADRLVQLGQENGMAVIGHTLIWHSQLAPWFATDEQGRDVSPEVLKQRMRDHIHTVVGRYKGRVKGWDVVNEAIEDDGSYRRSVFYRILGEEYIPLAFQYAHEADPDAELYYNDYSLANPRKREGVVRLVQKLKSRGLRIDAVGMQAHLGMEWPSVEEFEKSMLAFAATGVKVMVTELDLNALPAPRPDMGADIAERAEYRQELNPYPDGLPPRVEQAWTERMHSFFALFLRHSDIVTRVNLWGVADGDSWLNNWPVPGRTNYPLLFDRQHRPKPVVQRIIRTAAKP